jgi:glycosyltransferase involved in cell wall biosynthesis
MDDPELKGAYEWEVLFVNDGSKDRTLDILRDFRCQDSRISYIDLSRNFGKENAMLAGFDYVTGDCMIIMDADLQDPPYLIKDMLNKWEEGYDDVYAKRTTRGTESWLRKHFSLLFYWILSKTTKMETLSNVGDFRLLDRRCIEALKRLRETERYTKGLFCWVGYKKACIEFERGDRKAGQSAWNFLSLFKLAINGIVSFTTFPLRIATILGIIISIVSLIYMMYIFIKTLLFGDPVAGFPTLICVILFLGGMQLLSIGIIGEYVARIYNESKARPVYLVREHNGTLL